MRQGWMGIMDDRKDPPFTFSRPIEEAIRNIIREEIDLHEKRMSQKQVPAKGG